jgi:hypothetical protein
VDGSNAATIDPEDEMISGACACLFRQFHVGDGSKARTLPSGSLGGKSSGELVAQERPDRPRVSLAPRGLDGHHDRYQLKLEWVLRHGHRHHLSQFLPELLAKGALQRRAKRLPEGGRGVHGDHPLSG